MNGLLLKAGRSRPAFAFLAILGLAAAVSCASAPARDQDVVEAVTRFGDAYRRGDVAALESMLTADYIHTNGRGGVVTREQWLAFQRDRAAQLADGRQTLEAYENTALQIRRDGNVAVVVGENHARGTRAGSAFTTRLRFTQVWVLTPAGWRRAAYHDSDME